MTTKSPCYLHGNSLPQRCGVLIMLTLLSFASAQNSIAPSQAAPPTYSAKIKTPAPPPDAPLDLQAQLAKQNSLLNLNYPTEGKLVPYFNKTKITVCTSDWMPAVYCANITDTSKFTGLEVELFREVMTRMGISEDQLDWKCLAWDDLLNGLYNNTCDIAPAGMSALPSRIEKGLRFSVPSMRSGLRIMVPVNHERPGYWYFLSAMEWEVWVLLLLTGVAVGLIVWLMEIGTRSLTSDTRVLGNVMWDTLGRPVQMRDYRLHSIPANVTAYVWSFLAFIVMILYGANLTSNQTVNLISNNIKSVGDLPGKAVITYNGFVDVLKDYNLAATGFSWDNSEDVNKMIDALLSQSYVALVMDSNVLSVYDATNCNTMLVGGLFHQEDVCVGIPPKIWQNNTAFFDAFNMVMYSITQGTGGIEQLTERFVTVPQAQCKSQAVSDGYAAVYLEEVAGLWIILCGSIIFGILYIVAYRYIHYYKEKRRKNAPKLTISNSLRKRFSNLINSGMMKREDLFEADLMDHNERYDGASMGYIDGTADVQATYEYRDRMRNARKNANDTLRAVLCELSDLRSALARSNLIANSNTESGMQPGLSGPVSPDLLERAEVAPSLVVPSQVVMRNLPSHKLPLDENLL